MSIPSSLRSRGTQARGTAHKSAKSGRWPAGLRKRITSVLPKCAPPGTMPILATTITSNIGLTDHESVILVMSALASQGSPRVEVQSHSLLD